MLLSDASKIGCANGNCRARLAKIKQDQAKSMTKRGKGLGRKSIRIRTERRYADADLSTQATIISKASYCYVLRRILPEVFAPQETNTQAPCPSSCICWLVLYQHLVSTPLYYT